VVLPVALTGLEAADVAYRMDGLPVLLRKLLPTAFPTDREILLDLVRAV
jgi:formylmethanofuran dehydrogenase subunit B